MPCRVDGPFSESEVAGMRQADRVKHDKLKATADRLQHENDILRELLLRVVDGGYQPDEKEMAIVNKEQVKHRKQDLARLKKAFTKSRDAERLGKVMLADPNKPLEPQLGFDPDEF
jgi:hypothetical protein